jgi:hypothetical protein
MGPPVILALLAFLAQQTQPSKGTFETISQLASVVAVLLGAYATYLGMTSKARESKLTAEKADRQELIDARAEIRRLTDELRKMEDREWEATSREKDALARLTRVERALESSLNREATLTRRVAELEGNAP